MGDKYKYFEQLTIQSNNPEKYDTLVNQHLKEGWRVMYRKIESSHEENEGFTYIAVLERKVKLDRD